MMDLGFGVLPSWTLSDVVSGLVKVLLVMLSVMSLLVLRQVSMMNKVIDIPIANWFRVFAWGYFFLTVMVSAIILVV